MTLGDGLCQAERPLGLGPTPERKAAGQKKEWAELRDQIKRPTEMAFKFNQGF
jgi:hypothetical protein